MSTAGGRRDGRFRGAPRGPMAILFGIGAACGHTGKATHRDAITLGPAVAGPAPVASSDAATSSVGLSGVLVVDAAPEADERGVAGESHAPAASPIAHCLDDAGAATRTVIRFVNRPAPAQERSCPGDKQLALEIPSLGIVRQLCNSGCGPYDFDSQTREPDVATFVCENDSQQNTGTASVVDGVLHIQYFAKPRPATPFDDRPSSGSSSPVAPAVPPIALPCGTRPEFQTTGRSHWYGDVPVGGSSR